MLAVPLPVKFIHERLMLFAFTKRAPRCVLFWIVPPVPGVPAPVTVNPPAPVLVRTMPLGAPLDEMLWNHKPPAPMVVLVTVSAVPVVVVSVLPLPVTVTVPLFAAVNAALAPVLRATPPVKVTVVPTRVGDADARARPTGGHRARRT